MEDNSNSKRLVILFSICLVLLPSLLVSSLWMAKKRRPNHSNEVTNDVATKPDEYYYRDPRPQVVYLDHIVNKFRQDSNDKSSRYGSSYANLQVIDDTSVANNDYTSDADYHNDVDPHHYGEKPNCNEVTCSTTMNTATGSYKTIRTPGTQVEQCLSVTVALGSNIRITCTSINVSTGTYVTFLDLLGTNILANPPILNTAYTTADNTLIIKSLASSANADQLCCDWVTV
ncbi:hypothetical protein OUZ56_029118 [Daphnia magna]|uniref:CUB domain-containing protein n=1 Tax=Daphnia magna TaxID=35525 RepID=A0ABR0B5Y0_9CRUS|nr:hypothetical protein OUZ56_029118 [Daphnia magna]